MDRQPHILMCPPEFYGVQYEINPWMRRERAVDQALAVRQWSDLRKILQDLGATISLLEPVKDLPDLVFTANAALIPLPTCFATPARADTSSNVPSPRLR